MQRLQGVSTRERPNLEWEVCHTYRSGYSSRLRDLEDGFGVATDGNAFGVATTAGCAGDLWQVSRTQTGSARGVRQTLVYLTGHRY